jgi:hypothetical protein
MVVFREGGYRYNDGRKMTPHGLMGGQCVCVYCVFIVWWWCECIICVSVGLFGGGLMASAPDWKLEEVGQTHKIARR